MIDISVKNVKKAFEEGNDILDDLSFDVNEGERVGLLGKNGVGKTTLLRLITGEMTPDEGTITMPAFKKTGLISQIPEYPPHFTADDVMQAAFAGLKTIKSEMEKLENSMAEKGTTASGEREIPELLKAYDGLAYEYERLGGYNTGYEMNRVANGLRIPQEQRSQRFDSLSGGEKTRVNLARLILENTDILLLDEPTNHLDMRATEWLEEFLCKYRGTALIISHDRYFLDKTIGRAIEISAGKAEFYSGNYSFYVTEKQRRYEEQLEKFGREQAEARRLREAAARLHQWGTGNEMLMKKSRSVLKRAERAVQTEKPDKDKRMNVKFSEKEFHGDEVLIIRGLAKSYGDRQLFDIPELEVRGGERVAVIGDNGTGKSTLARMIMGEEQPDCGVVRLGPSVKTAYLPQLVQFDNPRRSILDTLMYTQNLSQQTARNRLGAFMFPGEDVFKQVDDLSGGEKSRLMLCMLMNGDINMLILDEPTNHLDLPSREWIEAAVGEYSETLLFISHDRYLIDRFATRVWDIEDGVFTDYKGSYSEYRKFREQRDSAQPGARGPTPRNPAGSGKPGAGSHTGREAGTGAPAGEAGTGAPADRGAGLYRGAAANNKPRRKPSDAQKEIRRIEREIEKLETELDGVQQLRTAHSSDYEKLIELDGRERETLSALERLYSQWESETAQAGQLY